jgi:hypothetical protein
MAGPPVRISLAGHPTMHRTINEALKTRFRIPEAGRPTMHDDGPSGTPAAHRSGIESAGDAFPDGLGNTWPLVAPEFPIAVSWSRKSANTTMLKWFLYQNDWLDEAESLYPNRMHEYWHTRVKQTSGYGSLCYATLLGQTGKLTVKVVRDPGRRAVSAFLHFIRDPKSGLRAAWEAFLPWKRCQGLGDAATATFEEFLRHILAARDTGTPLDPHFEPQWNPAQDPRVLLHVPLEDIEPRIRVLERLYGLRESPFERLSKSPHHNAPRERWRWPATAAHLPLDSGRLRTMGIPSAEVFFDDHTRSLIRLAYREDYEGYSRFYGGAAGTLARAA